MSSELESLVKRLENTTARLEALSLQKPSLPPKPGHQIAAKSTGESMEAPNAVKIFDDQVSTAVTEFVNLSKKIGGDLNEAADKLAEIFNEQKNFIWFASSQTALSDNELGVKLGPISNLMQKVVAYKDSKRQSVNFNHLSTIAEGIQSTGWLAVQKTPAPFIKDGIDSSMFYVNRVRKDHKDDADKVHMEWCTSWINLLNALHTYVRQNHTTGLVWNSSPGNVPSGCMPVSASIKCGGPPPPPPVPKNLNAEQKKPSGGDAKAELLAALNKGAAVTSGLKTVTADMMTHKNPSLRLSSVVAADANTPGGQSTKVVSKAVAPKTPVKELRDGKTWCVEYFAGDQNIVINADIKQVVYIFKCDNCVIRVNGKVNSILMDNCKKTQLVFDSLLSQIEIINSQSIKIQTLGALPTVSIQKTDGCQIYLSKESLGAEIVQSKSSEMNISVPEGDDGDFIEYALPEQFKTTYNRDQKKIHTVMSDI
uniref:Adenylyl cyclase-associated protein n=1 Tax=Rhabditophanes sp. KR3021 TaxID=114890 RepID=A0AC35UAC4_9BILA